MNNKLLVFIMTLLSVTTLVTSAQAASTAADQSIRSIVLHNGWLSLINPDGDVIMRERISDIRTIVFAENQTGSDILDIPEENIRIYPNPVQNILYIESANVPEYQIFDVDGRCLLKGENSSIDVSILKTGTYLLLINNQTFKFIKQ